MVNKKQNGQFFTKNSDYILSGFSSYIKGRRVIDPFAGNKDLITWAQKNHAKSVKGYDVDGKYVDKKTVFHHDSINSLKKYDFVITNPPYLNKNKADKETKEKYFSGNNSIFEDLYQISLNAILNSNEGILIVPLNFLSAENSKKIREIFFNKFQIISLSIFKEQVFEDTTYNVISFYYKKIKEKTDKNIINATIFPDNKKIKIILEKKDNWQIGGNFFTMISATKNLLGVYRLTEKKLIEGKKETKLALNNIKNIQMYHVDESSEKILKNNIIFLRAIDSKNGKKIQLEDIRNYGVHGLVGKESSRNMAYLLFKEKVDIGVQSQLILYFNKELNQNREKYLSLFLTNFRDNNRKRISFDFTYKLINYIFINKISFS